MRLWLLLVVVSCVRLGFVVVFGVFNGVVGVVVVRAVWAVAVAGVVVVAVSVVI